MAKLNSVLEGRLYLGKASLTEYGVSILGQEIEMIGNGLDELGQLTEGTYNYVDCFFIQILQCYGVVFTVLWLGIVTYSMYRAYRLRDYGLLVCMTMIAAHCIIDDLSLKLYYNTFWLACGIIFKTKEEFAALEGEHANSKP